MATAIMKTIALLAALTTVGVGLQSALPPALDNHVKNLQAAKGLKVEFSVLRLSGGAEKITALYAKPNLFRLDSSSTLKVSDGTTLYTLDKKKNTYTEAPATFAAVNDSETWAWSAFFNADALKGISNATSKGKRQMRGVMLEEWAFKFTGGDTGSLYIDPANGVAKGYSRSGKGETIILANSVTVAKEAADAKEFTFVPGTAKKEEPKPVAAEVLYSEISPIMAQRCNGCHSSGSPKAGVITDNYQGLTRIVTPGNSAASNFYKVISGPNPRMPKGGGKMTAEEIEKIKNWIDSGAKQ